MTKHLPEEHQPSAAAAAGGQQNDQQQQQPVSTKDDIICDGDGNTPKPGPPLLLEHAASSSTTTTTTQRTTTSTMGLATTSEVFSFGNGISTFLLFIGGIILAAIAGAVGPFLIWYFAESFEDMSADPTTDDFMEEVKELSFSFLVLGAIAFCSLSAYSTLLQTAADQMTINLKTKWYEALLRQDLTYYDIQDVSGTSTIISMNAAKYQRGVGNKLGLLVQFLVTFIGSVIYAFYSSWQTSLVVLLTVPFMATSGWFLVKMTTSQSQRANASYAEAGAIVYTTITTIRTILSLNAVPTMITKFQAATTQAYQDAIHQVHWLGVANGSMMSSFLLSSVAVPLYGGYLLYDQVRETGCDPSGAIPGVPTCDPSGVDIFGAMFGIFFAASVLPQISTTLEAFTNARAACYLALQVMNRKSIEEEKNDEEKRDDGPVDDKDEVGTSPPSKGPPIRRHIIGPGEKAPTTQNNALPKYTIDSSSPTGLKLDTIEGIMEFKNVTFAYPTRMETNVLDDFSLTIQAGTTVALVGTSGSGKSTVTQLVERFYDPLNGSIMLDGHDLRTFNLRWLRQHIGLVSQEPTLFAASIRDNIAYGVPGGNAEGTAGTTPEVTMEQIEHAAKIANAHDFISKFPDGYNTQVGDKGTKLSGGQKQRIAIARTIIKNPKILVLDEATAALDSESEQVVQKAIDELLESSDGKNNRTTIVIAHRLSTVRNADVIVVLEEGKLVEMGSHDELMKKRGKYEALVQAQKNPPQNKEEESKAEVDPRSEVEDDDSKRFASADLEPSNCADGSDANDKVPVLKFRNVHFNYPSRPDSKILKDFNLSVRSGETLALVGPSGHGKSTIIQLIERFYDPVDGSIELDGVDLKSCNPKWLRSQIGLVSQEPTLFDQSIVANICFGLQEEGNVTQEQIERATREANAYEFITSFPDGFNTQVGEGGTAVSGGQKQRIAIARVLLRNPRILLLDEATSALDTQSEKAVQTALDKIMAMKHRTTVVIAHRLSTIRNADRIAVVVDGQIMEIGTYDQLMSKEMGHFRRLQAFQNLDGGDGGSSMPETLVTPPAAAGKPSLKEKIEDLEEKKRREHAKKDQEQKELEAIDAEREKRNANRARQLARGDEMYFLIGSIGAILTGAIFPAWGFIFAYMIRLLFQPVLPCDEEANISSCQGYLDLVADDMKTLSNNIAFGAVGTIAGCMIGYIILFYGFGTATERMNKRVRDAAYVSLIRQDVSFFDNRPSGKLTSQLQDDAALIHSFSGEPIRTLILNIASVAVGLVIGFYYMWPFAAIFLAILPFMGFGAEMEMKMYVTGEDEVGDDLVENEHSPGGIVIESLLNIRTIASLTLEKTKLKEYRCALEAENPKPILNNFLKGSGFGLGQFFQFWGLALMYWFGAWILHNQSNKYTFQDFIICMFALFFSLYGLTVALEGATDRKRAKVAADRIFSLIDLKSSIDPLSEEGLKGKAEKGFPGEKTEEGDADTSEECEEVVSCYSA